MPLPPLPKHSLSLVSERVIGEGGFMRIKRWRLRAHLASGAVSDEFVYDCLDRDRLDAVIIAPHFRDPKSKRRFVYLRSSLRPPVFFRPMDVRPFEEKPTLGSVWELPAGLVERDERSPDGLKRCAARELLEEVGFTVEPSEVAELGPSMFPVPATVGERHFYFHVEVDPSRIGAPTEDGSALEREATIVAIPLDEALALVRAGEIEDLHSEIGLRRLAEIP